METHFASGRSRVDETDDSDEDKVILVLRDKQIVDDMNQLFGALTLWIDELRSDI